MRISRRIVLAVILCMVVCLAACSKIAPETSKDYDNESSIPTQENQQRPLDIPQLETDNSETKNEENQMEIGEPKVEEKQKLFDFQRFLNSQTGNLSNFFHFFSYSRF